LLSSRGVEVALDAADNKSTADTVVTPCRGGSVESPVPVTGTGMAS